MISAIDDPEILAGYNADALGYRGSPAGLFRPRDARDVQEIVRWCHEHRHPLTPTALRSSTTGSCVCHEGYLISTEHLQHIVDLQPERRRVIVEPGLNLGDLKRELQKHGLFLPPDPTSENECTVGGAVACNASGARSLKYGAMRRWVRRLVVVLPDGEPMEFLTRDVDKNTTGYYGFQDPIQFFIGSEGTLGIITEIELECLDLPPDYIALYAFFPDEAAALQAAVAIRDRQPAVRCLEYFDDACLELLRRDGGVALPRPTGGMLFCEQEVPAGEPDEILLEWLDLLEELGALVDDTMVGDTRARREEMKDLRHTIPATLNERGVQYRAQGGGKLSTDWAVPYRLIPEVIPHVRRFIRREKLAAVYCYGHIGNGHPHFNLLSADAAAARRAETVIHEMCRYIGGRGGTITAEHGVGKVKRPFLKYMFPPRVMHWMRSFKQAVDPHGIMAPGNIFD
ncbi:MAG: FAD-binding oxidoreductase [Acidobacteria bacterium]|nr:FAD-binding oxidoreductase [Acidobacteriota bacterium]